jgi:Ca2+-binding EF-hand superfamily protein
MKKQFLFGSVIRRFGVCAFVSCVLANTPALRAQEVGLSSGGKNYGFQTTGTARASVFVINGSDIGTILLKTCDLDQDGKVKLTEFKAVASASFKLWDTNTDGNISSNELSAGLKEFFPKPPEGGAHGVRVINGVAVEIPPGEMQTPDALLTTHILSAADANKDGVLSLQEVNDFLEKNFSLWDVDNNGSLDGQELGAAFGLFALPDGIATSPAH